MMASAGAPLSCIMVYAACGSDSAAGRTQQQSIDALADGGEDYAQGKCPFTMLLYDLSAELKRWRDKGCSVIVGGDFNQRHDRPGHEWAQLDAWRKRELLDDVLRKLHPDEEFVTYRAKGKRDAQGNSTNIGTWVDHCFASKTLLSRGVIVAAGVLDKRAFADGAKLAGSMHNSLSVAVDFGRMLNLSAADEPPAAAPQMPRFRYIHNAQKRKVA